MSISNKVLNLSLKVLECENPQPRSQDVTCQIYKNMEYICAAKLNESTNNYQTPIKQLSSNDSIQLILRNKFSNELIGSISFDFESFLKVGKNNFTQWITLFEDPEDDLFDGELEVDDEELPRLLVDFVLADGSDQPKEKNGAIFIAASQDQSDHSPSKNNIIDSELEMPESKSPIKQQQEHSPRFDTEEDGNVETDANKFSVTFKPLAITAMQQRLNDYKNQNDLQDFMQAVSFRNDAGNQSAAQRIQTIENPMETYPNEIDDSEENLGSPSVTSSNGNIGADDSDYAVKLLKKDFAKEIALLSDKLQQANDLAKNAKELRQMLASKNNSEVVEDASSSGNVVASESVRNNQNEIKALKQQNQQLNEKVASVSNAMENLKKENIILKNNEATHSENLYKMKVELEKYKFNSGGSEKIIQNLQIQLSESQEQIQQEIQTRLKVIREKEKISESYQNLSEEHQQLKANYEQLVREKLAQSQNQPSQKEKELFEQEKQTLTQENNKLQKKVLQAESQSVSQGNIIQMLQDSIKTLREERESARVIEAESRSVTPVNNSANDQILINTLLAQIEDLKAHVKQSEDEKIHLKEELFKANDNYMKLTNKYIELTEAFTVNQSGSSTGRHTTRNPTSRSRTPTKHDISHTSALPDHDVSDEIEHKLNEFIQVNRLAPSNFNRIDKTNYVVNAKRITLKLAAGKLLVRQGTGYQPLEDYLRGGQRSGQLQNRTPPISARINQTESSLHHSPERKANVSPRPRKVENLKTEEYAHAQSYDWESKNHSKNFEKEDVRQSAQEHKKIVIEARLSRNENLKSKDLNHLKGTVDKKPINNVVNNVYKVKGKTHKDLSPVLRTQPKHV